MEVRPAVLADAPGLGRVHVAAWRSAYAGTMPDAFLAGLDEARFARGWETAIADGETFVGVVAGAVEGFVTVGAPRDDDAPVTSQLWALNLHPEAFGSGLASALHGAAVERLAVQGHLAAYLWVAEDNPRARRFYEREGWTADGGTKTEEFGGAPLTEVRYVRRIAS